MSFYLAGIVVVEYVLLLLVYVFPFEFAGISSFTHILL